MKLAPNSNIFMHSQNLERGLPGSFEKHFPKCCLRQTSSEFENSKIPTIFMYIKLLVSQIFVWNHIPELLSQIIDDLVVFRDIFYFKEIGIAYDFICSMKWAPNSNIFVLSMSVEIKAT
jgi:hypothetical protein